MGEDWSRISLTSIMPAECQASGATSADDNQEQCFRLGLGWICDTADPDYAPPALSWWRLAHGAKNIVTPTG